MSHHDIKCIPWSQFPLATNIKSQDQILLLLLYVTIGLSDAFPSYMAHDRTRGLDAGSLSMKLQWSPIQNRPRPLFTSSRSTKRCSELQLLVYQRSAVAPSPRATTRQQEEKQLVAQGGSQSAGWFLFSISQGPKPPSGLELRQRGGKTLRDSATRNYGFVNLTRRVEDYDTRWLKLDY